MYVFTKLGLKKGSLSSKNGTNLQGFNGSITCLYGFIELLVAFGEESARRTLVVSCKSVYNHILWIPTLAWHP